MDNYDRNQVDSTVYVVGEYCSAEGRRQAHYEPSQAATVLTILSFQPRFPDRNWSIMEK
jgi:hypothetical protein